MLKSDYFKLLPILALAFYIAFIPHADYPYAVHVDEWLHIAESRAMLDAGSTTFPGAFSGGMVNPTSNLETGFQLFWGLFQNISGVPWMTIARYFPGVIFMLTVFSVYVLARRQGFGWEAALATCLIPTTVGILGPAFLVPVAMGLPFIPLSLFVAFNYKNFWSYIAILLFTTFLISIHAPSAISLVIILTPFIVLNLKGDFKRALGITLALIVPFLAPFPWIFALLAPTFRALLSPVYTADYIQLPLIIPTYFPTAFSNSYIPVAVFLLGIIVLVIKKGKQNASLALGLFLMLLMLSVFYTLHYGVPILYERGLMFAMLMISVVAGAGLMGIKELKLPEKLTARLGMPPITRNVGVLLCLALIGVILATAIPARQNIPYYHMIDQEDYEAFTWIENNVGADYQKAILEPWKGTAFSAITRKTIYTRIHSAPLPIDTIATDFLKSGAKDTAFLRENGISIVYSKWGIANPDLVEVRDNVYLLKPEGK